MTRIAFYAPLKSPRHPTPSGDREMARGLIMAMERAGYDVDLASELRSFDRAGDRAHQSDLKARATAETQRILKDAPDWSAWVSYHSYYKSPDLIGPAVSQTLGIPYMQIESTRARKRLEGPWADFAQASETASDHAALIFHMTERDLDALEAYASKGQILKYLPPFLHLDHLPDCAQPTGPDILSIGMFRDGAKMQSYALIAQTLPLLKTPDWTLTIVGDGPERDAVQSLFAPFADRVSLVGQLTRDEINARLHSARAFFWPGVDEAYGMVYLEAQAAGLPVVAQNRDGVRDVLAATGCDVQGGPLAMASALDAALQEDAFYAKAASKARDKVQSKHLLPHAAAVLHESLERLI